MERRVLLAIFLAFLVLYAWQALFVKPVAKPASTSNATAPAAGPSTPRGDAQLNAEAPPPAPAPAKAPDARAAAPLVSDTAERDVRVETRDVIAVFTNRGARLKSWRLKHYLDQQQQPQELIEHDIATQPLPFTLRTANDAETSTLNGALYSVGGAPAAVADSPVDL